MRRKEDLVEVRDNIFLAKSDPSFLEKYLKYFPNDRETLCKYAEKLENDGDHEKALIYFGKAAENGSIQAKRKLKNLERQKLAERLKKEKNEKRSKMEKTYMKLMFLCILSVLLLILLLFLINDKEHTNNLFSSISKAFTNESSVNNPKQPSNSTEAGIAQADQVYKKDELLYLIVINALERYYEERGEYPNTINELILNNPENWISFVPKSMVYLKEDDGFSLTFNGAEKVINSTDVMKLYFYPATNEIALVSNGKVLAIYPVASGVESLPFISSKVLARVVDPNGGDSSLGTRGLVLQDNFAIHGTNDPDSIGNNATAGCLRMFNEDIEVLYSYISKGTTFFVKEGKPTQPMFPMGLPILHDGTIPFGNETTPSKVYKWKN